MVRKMCDIFDKKVAITGLICYIHGSGINTATYYTRDRHVSKNFKIDKERKVL